jgi:Lon protease-like protein
MAAPVRIPVFPLAGALLFPRTQLPLHIFEPRYRTMVRDALAGDRLIGMVQPRDSKEPPALFGTGCLGHIEAAEELEDGRFNLVLAGLSRFRILRELLVQFMQFQRMVPGGADGPETLQ